MAKKKDEKVEEKKTEATEETSLVEEIAEAAGDVVESVADAVAETASDVVEAASDVVKTVVETVSSNDDADTKAEKKGRKRSEKVGIVQSDKMTKTVTVRVDRVVKHPMYRKYIKRKKKFMAHDELGAAIGDKVRIVETRPMSAKKRWRVVEIVQKAER